MKTILCYTDGSCDNKKGIGGFGVVLRAGEHRKDYSEGRFIGTTSARMEIMAVIRALEMCNPGWHVVIHTDNQYVQKTIEIWLDGWMKKGILKEKANADLWEKFHPIYQEMGGKNFVKVKWVKGHAGNEFNELADRLANEGRLMVNERLDARE